MPARSEKPKKGVKKAEVQKQIQLVNKEFKQLKVRIQDLTRTLERSHFRIL